MDMRHLRALVVAVAVPFLGSLVACGGHSSAPALRIDREAAARTFGVRLIDVLERDDLIGFQDLLSANMQRRKASERELLQMFTTWRHNLVPYAQALRDADWTVAYNEPSDARPLIRFRTLGSTPESLIRVVDERGALRIDEN